MVTVMVENQAMTQRHRLRVRIAWRFIPRCFLIHRSSDCTGLFHRLSATILSVHSPRPRRYLKPLDSHQFCSVRAWRLAGLTYHGDAPSSNTISQRKVALLNTYTVSVVQPARVVAGKHGRLSRRARKHGSNGSRREWPVEPLKVAQVALSKLWLWKKF